MTSCWLAEHGIHESGHMPPCEGRAVKAHLIPQQTLKRTALVRSGELDLWDERLWRWACGGYGYGCSGHHGEFDTSKRLRVPWEALSDDLLDLAEQLGPEVEAFVVRTYLPRTTPLHLWGRFA